MGCNNVNLIPFFIINFKAPEISISGRVTICGGSKREKHIYTSSTNRVEIRVVGSDRDSFLIKYSGKNIRPLQVFSVFRFDMMAKHLVGR